MLQDQSTESSVPCWIMPAIVVRPRASLGNPEGDPEGSWTNLAACACPHCTALHVDVFVFSRAAAIVCFLTCGADRQKD